jgi:hypothetical protein
VTNSVSIDWCTVGLRAEQKKSLVTTIGSDRPHPLPYRVTTPHRIASVAATNQPHLSYSVPRRFCWWTPQQLAGSYGSAGKCSHSNLFWLDRPFRCLGSYPPTALGGVYSNLQLPHEFTLVPPEGTNIRAWTVRAAPAFDAVSASRFLVCFQHFARSATERPSEHRTPTTSISAQHCNKSCC